jgi:hypothetical protein
MKKSRYSEHLPPKRKRAPAKAGSPPALVGTAYSLEQIQDLLSGLQSYERDTALGAMVEFVSNYEAISEGAQKTPDITISEVVAVASAAIERSGAPLIEKLEQGKMQKELAFLSEASYISKNLREEAAKSLKRLSIRMKKAAKKLEESARSSGQKAQGPRQSPSSPAGLEAAEKILGSASSGPPPAEAVRAALSQKDVLENLVPYLAAKMKLPELKALSSLPSAPPKLRMDAAKALASLPAPGIQAPATQASAPHRKPVPQAPVKSAPRTPKPVRPRTPPQSAPVEEAPLRIDTANISALLKDLDSAVSFVAVPAVVKSLKNYEAIAEFLSTSPITTVTKFSEKLFSALERNAGPVLKELGRDRKVLEFLLLRPGIPMTIKKRVREILHSLG